MFVKAVLLTLLSTLSFNVCMADIDINTDEGGRLNVKLKGIPLTEIKSVLEQGYGILFKGDDQIYQTQLTLSFQNLSLEKALKRIFSRMSFALVYDSEGKITEVYVLSADGKKINHKITSVQPKNLSTNFKKIYAEKYADKQTLDHLGENNLPADKVKIPPPKSMVTPSEETAFKVVRNSPPGRIGAGDPSSFPLDDTFEITPNSPPSGSSFQIVPSAPPARK